MSARFSGITITWKGWRAGIAAIGATLVALMSAGAAQAQSDCPGADTRTTDSAALEAALECLITKERVAAGVPALKPSGPLRDAARDHANDMVDDRFFATTSPTGESVNKRADRWGYGAGALGVEVGGLISTGSGTAATPRVNFESWRTDPTLSKLLLNPKFQDLGVGATPGSPISGEADAATYVAYFGSTVGTVVPVFGTSVGAEVLDGTVTVAPPGGKYQRVAETESIPVGSVMDTRVGKVRIAAASGAGGAIERGDFDAGKFKIAQIRGSKPITELSLSEKMPSCRRGSGSKRRLWASSKGGFRTKGKYATATGAKARWLTEDSCAGTRISARSGVVTVRNRKTKKTYRVRAGRSILVRP